MLFYYISHQVVSIIGTIFFFCIGLLSWWWLCGDEFKRGHVGCASIMTAIFFLSLPAFSSWALITYGNQFCKIDDSKDSAITFFDEAFESNVARERNFAEAMTTDGKYQVCTCWREAPETAKESFEIQMDVYEHSTHLNFDKIAFIRAIEAIKTYGTEIPKANPGERVFFVQVWHKDKLLLAGKIPENYVTCDETPNCDDSTQETPPQETAIE